MEDLIDNLSSSLKVDIHGMGEHPRYSMFKNIGKAADAQASRREAALLRQRECRWNQIDKMRKLAYAKDVSDEECGDEEIVDGGENVDKTETYKEKADRTKNRYEDVLMTSEWLVDIPSQLSSEWIMVVAPKGKRVLVVASKGTTTLYDKRGRVVNQFPSHLPGSAKGSYSILDCILDAKTHTVYVLDLLCWNEFTIADNPFDFRNFYLQSRFEENPQLSIRSHRIKYKFMITPRCGCEKKTMEELMRKDMGFEVDGLLFYCSQANYTSGQSPLVGWLKPFMLPEIIGVEVPASYHLFNTGSKKSTQYIKEFNKKHKHESKIDKEHMMD